MPRRHTDGSVLSKVNRWWQWINIASSGWCFRDSESPSRSLNGLDLGGLGDSHEFGGFKYDNDLMGGIG
ncbi:hypothetical protein C1H46_004853 [Malus baccata]|uniref:Uncharacterized protein n=1 Tax=Malus baccata TaxID=106549 RepID=A0A540NEN2_MALBA|nr:hypothetical protein C1H46_004853 [Malus baccata]